MSITIVQYQSRDELRTAHPGLKNLTVVHQCGTRETLEETITALHEKHVQGRYYQVGNFIWQEAQTMPPLPCRDSPPALTASNEQ